MHVFKVIRLIINPEIYRNIKALDKRIALILNKNLFSAHYTSRKIKDEIFIRRMNESIIHLLEKNVAHIYCEVVAAEMLLINSIKFFIVFKEFFRLFYLF